MLDNHLNKEDKRADGIQYQNRHVLMSGYLGIDKNRIEQNNRQDKLVIQKNFLYQLFNAAKVQQIFGICNNFAEKKSEHVCQGIPEQEQHRYYDAEIPFHQLKMVWPVREDLL